MLFSFFYISGLKPEVTSHILSHIRLLTTILDMEDYIIYLSLQKVLLNSTEIERKLERLKGNKMNKACALVIIE